MSTGLEVVEALLRCQHALVTWHQLVDAKLTERQIAGFVNRGLLRRVRPRVYGLVGAPESWERALLAVILSVGEGAVASHAAAARLWGFAHRPMDALELTVSRLRRTEIRGVRLHRSALLTPHDVATRDGIPCTTFERTLCDCTTLLSAFQLGRTLDDGLRRGIASVRRLSGCLERLDSGPGRRLSVVRTLVDERGDGYDPGGSASELRVLNVLRAAGLPEPVQQLRVEVNGQTYFPDYSYPNIKVFIEYYGLVMHSLPSSVAHDSERVSALCAAGWRPLIFTDATSDRKIVRDTAALLKLLGGVAAAS